MLIHYTECPVCASSFLKPVFPVKDYLVSGQIFELVECEECHVRLTQDVPDAGDIGQYYQSENYISHTDTDLGIISRIYKKVRSRTLVQKAKLVEKYTHVQKGNLLDVGCGTGAFANIMYKRGWHVTGVEPDEGARNKASELYNINALPLEDLASLPDKYYDAVTLWHVLEHVHHLQDTVELLKNKLLNTGLLFIAVPNYTSKDSQAYKQYWAAYDVPRHLYHFAPVSMKKLLKLHGLSIVKQLPMWYDSFYISMLSSQYKTGKTKYISAGLHGLASNIGAVGNAGFCSSVIYVIKKH